MTLEEARAILGPEIFADAWRQGVAIGALMTVEQMDRIIPIFNRPPAIPVAVECRDVA